MMILCPWTRNKQPITMDISSHMTSVVHAIFMICVMFEKVLSQQTFLLEPTDQQGIRGQTILLPCQIDNLVGDVTWMRDGFGLGLDRALPGFDRYRLDGSEALGEYTLMISNLQLEDDAVYQCQVMATRTTPVMVSREAQVTVYIPPDEPTIEGGPVVEVIAGDPYNLTCRANNGKPAAEVSWFEGALPITHNFTYFDVETRDDIKLENATGAVTIQPRKSDQGRRYYCEVQNAGTPPNHPKSASVTLEVHFPPEVSMSVKPRYDNLKHGDMVTFTCEGHANPAITSWRWFRGTEDLTSEKSHVMVKRMDRDWHNTKVQCEATNTVGSTRQSVTISVTYPPQFTDGPEHVSADVGDDATLACAVDSNPSPTIIWTKEGSDKILSSRHTLTVYGVTEGSFGVYVCRASTLNTSPISMRVYLMKKGPPVILSPPEQAAQFGETGRVICQTRSIPKPTDIQWYKDGEEIDFENLDRYQMRSEDLPNGKKSIVEITSVQDSDYGTYNCSVSNGYGGPVQAAISFIKKDVVALEYIIAGVLVGVFIIIVIAVVLVVYHRKRSSSSSDTDSDTSASSISKRKEALPGVKVEYYPGSYGNPSIVEAWKNDADNKMYRRSADYDELNIVPKDPWLPDPYDYRDGYGSHYGGGGGHGYARSDYGTYPGPVNRNIYDTGRYGSQNIYGPTYSDYGTYGTYGRHPPPAPRSDFNPAPRSDFTSAPRSDFIPASELGRPSTAMSSRLSTNV